MVRERDPSIIKEQTSTPTKPQTLPASQTSFQRTPLANISAKMQSPSPKQTSNGPMKKSSDQHAPVFGEASPLRNPLSSRPKSNVFIPSKPRAFQHPSVTNASSQQPRSTSGFRLPGQASSTGSSAPLAMMQEYMDQSLTRGAPVSVPTNRPQQDIPPAPRPVFSSGPASSSNMGGRHVIDLTREPQRSQADEDQEAFDPDAAIRAEDARFGAPDPYVYMDSSQANENIKNLLEGAFDDEEDRPKTRLRKRAKKALEEGNTKEAKGLAARLASLDVKDETADADNAEDEEEDDGTVEGMSVKLLPHQVEGVGWMIEKEIGHKKTRGQLPKGGILADDMGLGKTVQSVALILTNARPGHDARPEHPKQKLPGKEVSKCTLVVAPLALIKQWEDEIKTKVNKSHALKVLVHHGPSRTKSGDQLNKYDVVITTYQTLTSEHAGSNMTHPEGSRIGCFGVHWYRIMLDEAHSIKNRNAKSTLACCDLQSWYRWCLTGTPMQNNLDELQSLIKFLRIKPYCELHEWKTAITQPMKAGRGGLAMRRLRTFLQAFMKRRTKDILKQDGALNFGGKVDQEGEEKKQGMQIVKREVITVACEFDEMEQEFYDDLQARADERLEAIQNSGKNDYMGALVLLLRLRQVCDHPNLIKQAMNKDKDAMALVNPPATQGSSNDMDDLTTMMGGISVKSKHCEVCQVDLTPEESKAGAARCGDCEAVLNKRNKKLRSVKRKNKAKKDKVKDKFKRKSKGKSVENDVDAKQKRKNHHLPDDSDEEDEGEWIGDGSEQHIDLGKAGGDDDEDAEGGGETLDSIDSVRSEDDEDAETEEDSPPRARTRKRLPKVVSDDEDEEGEGSNDGSKDHDEASEDDGESDTDSEDDEDEKSDGGDDTTNFNILHGIAQSSVTRRLAPSTKVRELLRILHSETPKHKTIVFSQFTSMLDLIEPHLKTSNLRYVRYDGSMRNDAREAALHALRNDKRTRVLLCSLKCGSLGLNLTAASRVVIIEPFWNPFVEEQAIDRVHRLNQTVDVKVYRLTIRDTVEERILALQERKRELAKAAIEGGGKAAGKLTMKEIFSLFGRDAEHAPMTAEDAQMLQKFGGDQRLFDGASAGISSARDDLGIMGSRSSGESGSSGTRPAMKVGRPRPQEHDVYGRRW